VVIEASKGALDGIAPGHKRLRPFRREFKYHLLVAPAMLLSAMVVLVPGVLTAVAAFTDWNGISLHPRWVGFANFTDILSDPVFKTALTDNLKWALMFATIPVAVALGAALLLLHRPKTRTMFQIIFLIPYVLAAITNAILWLNIIYNPVTGLWGYLESHGIVGPSPLSDVGSALYAVAGVDMWHFWGFLTVIYLAALRQTPPDQLEAAVVEGASGRQLFRYVYLPSIGPTLMLMFVMITIFSFLSFDYIYLLTGGGPAHASEVLSTYAYTFAFSSYEFGKAAAVGLIMSFFGLVCSVFYVLLSRREFSA
jgi:raffinose/stachyose/melibiose transport system permease protein